MLQALIVCEGIKERPRLRTETCKVKRVKEERFKIWTHVKVSEIDAGGNDGMKVETDQGGGLLNFVKMSMTT